MLIVARAAAAAMAIAWAPTTSHAQAVPGTLVQGENDALDVWLPKIQRPDGEYTNGLRVSISRSVAPLWGRLMRSASPCTGRETLAERCLTTEFAIAQQMYTPLRDGSESGAGDRSFAGWLHADVTANIITATRLTSFRIEAGFTGPPTLAEALQKTFHELLGVDTGRGWRDQLGFLPAGSLSYTDQLRAVLASSGDHALFEILPAWNAQLGNSRTSAYGELIARAGYHVSHPWSLASRVREGRDSFGVWLYGGARETLVAYDQTLDRSWSRNDSTFSVERIPWVGSYEFGIAVRRHSLMIVFGGVHDAREYKTEVARHSYGSLTVTVDRGLER